MILTLGRRTTDRQTDPKACSPASPAYLVSSRPARNAVLETRKVAAKEEHLLFL